MKKQMIKATLLLSAGGFASKALGAVYRIILSNILGAEGMGLYQLLFPLYSFALVFVTGGLTLALSKYVAQAKQHQDYKKISIYFWSAFFICMVLGLLFALIFALFAPQIAILQGDGSAYFGYYPIAIAVFFASLLACFRGLFQGYSNMVPTFVSTLVEQVFKLMLGLLFAFYLSSFHVSWAVFGALCAIAISELLTFLYLVIYTLIENKKKKIKLSWVGFQTLKQSKNMLLDCFPLTMTALLFPLAAAIQSLFGVGLLGAFGHSQTLSTALFGIQNGMVNAIIGFPSVIVVALATSAVPSISALVVSQKHEAKRIVQEMYLIVWILVVPCVVGLFVFSQPIMDVAFSRALNANTRLMAGQLLAISSFVVLFLSLIQTTTVLLQVLGAQWKAFWSLAVFFVTDILLLFLLVPKYSIYGLALANVISYALCSVVCFVFFGKIMMINMKLKKIFLPIIIALLMGVFSKLLFNYLPISWVFLKLIIAIIFAIIFYFSFLILFKVILIKRKNNNPASIIK